MTSTASTRGSLWDQDLEQGRRVAFWQRVYLQTLAQLQARPALLAQTAAEFQRALAVEAGEAAAQAVRRLDEWQALQAEPADAAAPPRDAGGEEDDDPDGGYLGR